MASGTAMMFPQMAMFGMMSGEGGGEESAVITVAKRQPVVYNNQTGYQAKLYIYHWVVPMIS